MPKVNKIYVWNKLVFPVWKPWANTVAYWELNGNWNDTKNNYWVTTYTTTNYNSDWYVWAWNPTYNTYRNGKKCAYFDWTRALKFPALPIPSNTLTFSVWIKINANQSSLADAFQLREDSSGNGNSTALEFCTQNWKIYPQWIWCTSSTGKTWQTAYTTTGITYSLDTRYNVVVTFNAWTLKFYVNGSLIDTATGNAWLRNNWETPSYIWWQYKRYWSIATYLNFYIQDVIYENKVWSDTDVLNYYDITK